jgi:hypothetical protein
MLKHVTEGKTRKKTYSSAGWSYENEKILKTDIRSTRSQYLENWIHAFKDLY